MRWWLPLLLLLSACVSQTGSTTTTTDLCIEAEAIWENASDALEKLNPNLAANDYFRRWHTERMAVVAEKFPQCFSVEDRVYAEAAKRLLDATLSGE